MFVCRVSLHFYYVEIMCRAYFVFVKCYHGCVMLSFLNILSSGYEKNVSAVLKHSQMMCDLQFISECKTLWRFDHW